VNCVNKRQELEAARNMEPDCEYGAVGAGRYGHLLQERLTETAAESELEPKALNIRIDTETPPLDSTSLANWASFLSTVHVSGALPVTFRLDGDHVVIEVVVPYVPPETPEIRDMAGPHKIPLQIAEGFPVPLTARCKLPIYHAESAANFVRDLVREIYLHEADEQLRIGDHRPFASEH
jgi:hypothetical protein